MKILSQQRKVLLIGSALLLTLVLVTGCAAEVKPQNGAAPISQTTPTPLPTQGLIQVESARLAGADRSWEFASIKVGGFYGYSTG